MTALEQGHHFEQHGRFAEALACYDRAIAESRAHARPHGIAWMNRGNALQKIAASATTGAARAEAFAASLHAYDQAIAALATLPIESDPACRNHLGAAWLNRGHLQMTLGDGAAALAPAADSFARAIALLERLPLEADPYFRLNLAGAQVNLAHALLDAAPGRCRAAAQDALTTLAAHDREHPLFAEMSLRARRAFVMSLGSEPEAVLVSAGTDAIEDGLALNQHWTQCGESGLQPLALRLFRLGAQLYRVHQPQFLAEFVLEQVAAVPAATDPGFRPAGAEALDQAILELRQPRIVTFADADAPRLLEIAAALRRARQELALNLPFPPSTPFVPA